MSVCSTWPTPAPSGPALADDSINFLRLRSIFFTQHIPSICLMAATTPFIPFHKMKTWINPVTVSIVEPQSLIRAVWLVWPHRIRRWVSSLSCSNAQSCSCYFLARFKSYFSPFSSFGQLLAWRFLAVIFTCLGSMLKNFTVSSVTTTAAERVDSCSCSKCERYVEASKVH